MAKQCYDFDYSTLSTSITRSELPADLSINFENSSVETLESCEEEHDSMDAPLLSVPRDRHYFVFFTFFLLGICSLLPWNFFITANDYWMYKFRNVSSNTSYDPNHKNFLQTAFTSYLAIANNVPFIVILFLNPFFCYKIPEKIRNGGSLVGTSLVFCAITTFIKIPTDAWQTTFFAVTMFLVCLISVTSGVFQGGVAALAAIFPAKYMYAVMTGQAVAGIISSLSEILSLLNDGRPTDSALGYFMCAILIIVCAKACYFIMHKTAFFRYHIIKVESFSEKPGIPKLATVNIKLIISVFKKVWIECVTSMLVYWVTLSVFPAVCVLVLSKNYKSGDPWDQIYFLPVCCFLLFNISDFVGRTICKWISVSSRWLLLSLSIIRIVYIPLFMMCNTRPRSILPVVFGDVEYILLIVTLGITNGSVCTLAMIAGPKRVASNSKEIAGFILVAFLGAGLTLGSVFSYVIIELFFLKV
ncbi:equilibrative nucleoside transporter 1 [Centruroides vittatus]|uniref:equilibrative nucleoside transporter 1 n=1 Tax=Centruroides vittatus TaxID=120091 RepID=UPI00351006F1